jgi:C-5 cytosine-specific DNA methylase
LCGGLAAGVEAAVLAGYKVNCYQYVDIDPVARGVAAHRLCNLTARYPHLLPPSAWQDAFCMPQDLSCVLPHHLDDAIGDAPQQILLMAGWPCQDYSSAGLGKQGTRARLLDKVLELITHLQMTQPMLPMAYVLENVAMQHNFRHAHVREEVSDSVMQRLGSPICFDAAKVGSYASRVRNYWTNLTSAEAATQALRCLECPNSGDLYDILQPNRHPMPVDYKLPGTRNEPGQARRVLPTLVAYHMSRAFRKGRAGCILDESTGALTEPVAVERELAMGYQAGTTAADGVTDRQRCALLGQAMDLNALFALFTVAAELHTHSLASVATRVRVPAVPSPRLCMASGRNACRSVAAGDHDHDSLLPSAMLAAYVGQQPTDVWEDGALLA